MNAPTRQDLLTLAAQRSAAYPADLEDALQGGLRSYRYHVILGYALAIAAIVVITGILVITRFAGTGTVGNGPAPVATLLSITIRSESAYLLPGAAEQLSAEGHYSDGSSRPLTKPHTWTSDAPDVAVVNEDGRVVAAAPGTTLITVTQGDARGTMGLTVTDVPQPALTSIAVVPESATLQIGQTLQLDTIGSYDDGSTGALTGAGSWRSSNPTVATVDDAGVVTGLGAGNTIVTLTVGGLEASAQVTIDSPTVIGLVVIPEQATLNVGEQQQFTANFTYSDGSTGLATAANWTTSADKVVQIDPATGLATAVGNDAEQSTVTVTAGGLEATAQVTINSPTVTGLVVTPEQVTLNVGEQQQFTANFTYSDGSTGPATAASWETNAKDLVEIDPATGLATAVGNAVEQSTVTVTVTAGQDGFTRSATVLVPGSGIVD